VLPHLLLLPGRADLIPEHTGSPDIALQEVDGFRPTGNNTEGSCVTMARLDYKDFSFRTSPHGNRGKVRAISKTKDAFLKTIDYYISKNNRKIINIETHEGFFRVWHTEIENKK